MSKQLCLWGAGKYGRVTRLSDFMAGDLVRCQFFWKPHFLFFPVYLFIDLLLNRQIVKSKMTGSLLLTRVKVQKKKTTTLTSGWCVWLQEFITCKAIL